MTIKGKTKADTSSVASNKTFMWIELSSFEILVARPQKRDLTGIEELNENTEQRDL